MAEIFQTYFYLLQQKLQLLRKWQIVTCIHVLLFTMLLIVYVKIKLCWIFIHISEFFFFFIFRFLYVTCLFSPVTSHFYTFSYLYTFFLFVRHEIFIYNSKIVPKIIYYKENGNEILFHVSHPIPVKQVHTFSF